VRLAEGGDPEELSTAGTHGGPVWQRRGTVPQPDSPVR
jgi:hypothetical protein